MKQAVMQPYVFPYIGYFQIIQAVDIFVFYDDVNFIKRGWVNRNKILLNEKDHYITIPCIKISQNKLIKEIYFKKEHSEFQKLTKTIEQAYKKAPYFDEVAPMIDAILRSPVGSIAELAQKSVVEISHYLGLKTEFKTSSIHFPETKGLEKADRLIAICKKTGAQNYINALGGKTLYDKSYFNEEKIKLFFLKPILTEYEQFNNKFIPGLSIIDVLMFNSKDTTKELINQYTLE